MERLFIDVCHFLCLVFHIAHGTSGRDDSYSWAIAHEDGVELEVDDHGDLEDAAAVLVFSDELLAVMKGFGLDILTPFSGCPELDDAWSVVDILAHSYDIVKELLAIELGILTEWLFDWFNGYHSVKSQVTLLKVLNVLNFILLFT